MIKTKNIVVQYCAIILMLIFASCYKDQETKSLVSTIRPGEVLDCLIINENGDFNSENLFPMSSCININELENRIKYLSNQYKISFWGPVCLVVQIEKIPARLNNILDKWDALCGRYDVPYVFVLWHQTPSKELHQIEVRSELLAIKKECIKEIIILPNIIQLRSYQNNLHWDSFCLTSQELLKEIKSSIYMSQYAYNITITNPNEQNQWRIMFDIAKFMNEHHLRYQFFFKK